MHSVLKLLCSDKCLLLKGAPLLATILLAGCAQKGDEPADAFPMLVSADTPLSRASSSLAGKYTDFGVWAWKTNADSSQSLVLGRAASADPGTAYRTLFSAEGDWTYVYSDADATQYLRYWDAAATGYRFAAYAPYSVGDTPLSTTHVIAATPSGVSISGIGGNTPLAEGIDWLEAKWERSFASPVSDTDLISGASQECSAFNVEVPLAFHHMLAVTEFRVYSGVAGELVLTDLSIDLDTADAIYTLGDYAAGTWTYRPESAATSLVSRDTSLDLTGTTRETAVSLATLLQLPQTVTGGTIHVTATVSDGSERFGSFELPEGWYAATRYTYYLCIKDGEIILLDVTADPWTYGDNIAVADPVTNW